MAEQIERLARIGRWEVDLATSVPSWSAGTYRIFGLDPSVPVTLEQAIALYAPEVRAQLEAMIGEAVASGTPYDFTLPHLTADGEQRWVRAIGQVEAAPDGRRLLIGVVRDVTDERAAEQRLRQLADDDALTGLCNRRVFLERLGRALATVGMTAGLALLLLDIDRFKQINDRHGHAAGDAVLVEVARRLRAGVRASDIVARLGGDEFAVILYGVATRDDAERRLQMLLALFEVPAELASGPLALGVSLGGSLFPDGGATEAALLRSADVALYQAKSLGRGQACLFDRTLEVDMQQRAGLLAQVRAALAAGELCLFYQPIIDLRTLAVRGLEALIRWRHPQRGLLGPAEFAAALADPALSAEIGSFVLSDSLRQMRRWIDAEAPVFCVNVNISESQLRDGGALFDQIVALLAAQRLSPDRLKLEILESAFLGHAPEAIAETLARLQRHGIVVALDDFGTGYASLTHLKQFDVGRIKIDRSFIQGLGADASSTAIVRAIVDLGRNLGIRVTAEGIETVDQLAALVQTGCDCGQGYLFSTPMPAERVPGFLRRWALDGAGLLDDAGRLNAPQAQLT